MPIYRGAYFEKAFKIRQRSDGAGLAMSTWQFAANFGANGDDVTSVLNATTAGGQFVVDPLDESRLKFILTPEETESLPAGFIRGDVLRTDSENGPILLFRVTLFVKDTVLPQ